MLSLTKAIGWADRLADRTGELRYVVFEDACDDAGPYHVASYFDVCTFYERCAVLYCAEPNGRE